MSSPLPPRLAFDDVVIDFTGGRLLRDGLARPLEPKAFAVLALLAGAPGRLFSRDEILDAVWGHAHVTPSTLNRVVTLLRQALGEDAQHPRLLHTVHGVGYRFDLPPAPAAEGEAPISPSIDAVAFEPDSASAPPAGVVPPSPTSRRPRAILAVFLALALLAVAAWSLWPRPDPPAASAGTVPAAQAAAPVADERSIAVLPLANVGGDPDQQFFSDGLSDNLIVALSRFEGLKVVGRRSSFQFRDGRDEVATIGAKLGVAYLVDGNVQRADDMVRINASLTRIADGRTLWAEHYDRPYTDLFALQDEIASAIAQALHAKLLVTGTATRQGDRPPGGSVAAYSAYLQGLKHWHDQDFPAAAEDMARAVQLDPDYALAWAHLSGAWSTVAAFDDEAPAVAREHMRIARTAADKALQLAPQLGAAHAARAYLSFYAFDTDGARDHCRRAVQLAPDDATVLNGCAYTLAGIGALEEALRLRERLVTIEPLYAINYIQRARLLMARGQLEAAEKSLGIADELVPQQIPSYHYMSVAILRGDATTARQIGGQQSPPWRDMNLALVAQLDPDRAVADAALAKVLRSGPWKDAHPYLIAQAYALRGDADGTLEWLEHARTRRDTDLRQLPYDPLILRFRDDPRLVAFCRQVGLSPPSASEALGLDQIRAMQAGTR